MPPSSQGRVIRPNGYQLVILRSHPLPTSLVAYGFDRDRVVQSIKFCICYATKNDFIRGATINDIVHPAGGQGLPQNQMRHNRDMREIY